MSRNFFSLVNQLRPSLPGNAGNQVPILQAYPSIGSLAKVYGTIAFILEHPRAVESYLREQEALWDKFREEHPLPDDILDRFHSTQELLRRPA